jgi:Na+-translocating ferredoxin:NAD+ oxidoreductase RnfG subunit
MWMSIPATARRLSRGIRFGAFRRVPGGDGMRKALGLSLAALAAAPAVPLAVYSEVYFTEDQVVRALFPGEMFVRKVVELTAEEARVIADRSGERVRLTRVVAWVSLAGNAVIVDQAVGKHEFITYAVGIAVGGKVKGIEIMEYQESYGYQIRDEKWRRQFAGKDAQAPLKLTQDIVNISGATLSCAHITGGVRRVMQTYEAIRPRL